MKINVCLTSIYDNLGILQATLHSLLQQTHKADSIILCLSEEPYLLDKGFPNKKVPAWLLALPVEILWTENTGPFRKLLPVLERLWSSDELILTVDDDTFYSPNLIETMYAKYAETGSCIACRCTYTGDPRENEYENLGVAKDADIYNFHTGKGGVLYHPDMFDGARIFNKEYLTLCPTGDDHWFNIWRMYNCVECVALKDYSYMYRDLTKKELALYHNYNEARNKEMFQKVAKHVFSVKIMARF
jgi:hypothetical protein